MEARIGRNLPGMFLAILQIAARALPRDLLGLSGTIVSFPRRWCAMTKDQDREKGALEQDSKTERGNTSLAGQLGHRDQDPMMKGNDSDFPEPGGNPEHSGEPQEIEEEAAA